MEAFAKWKKDKSENNRASAPVTIPVHIIVVHGLFDDIGEGSNVTIDRINSQMDVLNQDFARLNADASNTPDQFSVSATEISFCLATIDPMGNATDGVTRYATNNDFQTIEDEIIESTIWPPTKYLNIYLAPDLDGLLGYSSRPIPGILPATNNDVVRVVTGSFGGDGFATFPPYDLGRTATHEIGHWLGLRHVWGNGGCSSDDGFDDTPMQEEPNYDCPTHPSPSCSNDGDMFMNFMDYVNDNCMNSFSVEQSEYMSFIIEGTRTELINSASTACIPNGFPIVNIINQQNVVCHGEENGSFEVTATAAEEPFSYSLNGGAAQSGGKFTELGAGTYNLAVTSADGNTTEIQIEITQPDDLVFEVNILQEPCTGLDNGSIEINTTGGNSIFPDLQLFNNIFNVSQNIAFVQDFENGQPMDWTYDTDWEYGTADQLSSTSFPFPNTNFFVGFNDDGLGEMHVGGGSIYSPNIELFGAQNFKINFDAFFINGDYAGADETAKVYLSEDNGLTWIEALDLPGMDQWRNYTINLENWPVSNIKIRFAYDDGGGWNYGLGIDNVSIEEGNYGSFEMIPAGDYTLRATDSQGCVYEESVSMTSIDAVEINSLEIIGASCTMPGEVLIEATSVNGILEYQVAGMSNTSGTFSNLGPGDYTAIAIDNLGCSSSQDFSIEETGQIQLMITSQQNVSCFGFADGAFEIDISGAIGATTISMNGNNVLSSSFADLTAGNYIVEVQDESGCASQIQVEITEPEILSLTATVSDNSCFGPGQISPSTTGGTLPYTYALQGAQQTVDFDNLAPGTYELIVTDANGCMATENYEVQIIPADYSIVSNVISCSTGSNAEYLVELCTSDDRNVSWNIFDDQGVEILNPGMSNCVTIDLTNQVLASSGDFFYAVQAQDEFGCNVELNTMAPKPIQLITNPSIDQPITICENEELGLDLGLNASEFSLIEVLDENGDIYDPINGIYILTPNQSYVINTIDNNGCVSSTEFEVISSMLAEPGDVIITDATTEMGGSIQFSLDGDGAYLYVLDEEQNETGFFDNLPPGDYTLLALDEMGCQVVYPFTINMTSSTTGLELSDKISLYPNPVSDHLQLRIIDNQAIEAIKIYHTDGSLITSSFETNNNVEINTSGLEAGLYFIEVKRGKKVAYLRFVKM